MLFTASCAHLTRLEMADVIHGLVINDVIVSCLLSSFISTFGFSFNLISNLVCTSQFIMFKSMVNEGFSGLEESVGGEIDRCVGIYITCRSRSTSNFCFIDVLDSVDGQSQWTPLAGIR